MPTTAGHDDGGGEPESERARARRSSDQRGAGAEGESAREGGDASCRCDIVVFRGGRGGGGRGGGCK
eukprot:588483-Rhodomonas_salina.4